VGWFPADEGLLPSGSTKAILDGRTVRVFFNTEGI